MAFEFNAKAREEQGSSASRRLRRAGRVPGIVYGANKDAQSIDVDHNEIYQALRKEAFHSSLLSMNLDGKKQEVLLRDVQWHPYKQLLLHIDFQRVTRGVKVHQRVPVHFTNAELAPGVKLDGGMISHVMTEVDIECLPKNLPEFIEVDLKDMKVGESVHISQLTMPSGVTPVVHGHDDPVVVTLLAPKGGVQSDGEAGEEGAGEK